MRSKKQANRKDKSSRPKSTTRKGAPKDQLISSQAKAIQAARLAPHLLTPGDVLQLQRTIGNQATGQILAQATQRRPVQKKENSTGLPDNLKSGIESLSGYSMDDVK